MWNKNIQNFKNQYYVVKSSAWSALFDLLSNLRKTLENKTFIIKATPYLKWLPSGCTLLNFSTAKLERTNKIRSQKHNLNTKMKFWVNSEFISMEIDIFFLFTENFRNIFLNIEIECVWTQNTTVLRLKFLFKCKKRV